MNKKYKLIIVIILVILLIFLIRLGLIHFGIIMDNNLKYSDIYYKENAAIDRFKEKNKDFDIGYNKNNQLVFKNPKKAFKTLKKDYQKGINVIKQEFNLKPLSNLNYKSYKTYGWQVTTGSIEEQNEAIFISSFLDIYENSFKK